MASSPLNYAELVAPVKHAETLVAPALSEWSDAAITNAQQLAHADRRLLGKSLAHWRAVTRQKTVGSDNQPLVVTGHQPGFIHPGVWAKHVVATRFANAIGGMAVNIVVDSDLSKRLDFAVPTAVGTELRVEQVRFANATSELAYEQIPAVGKPELAQLRNSIAGLMGDRFDESQMPIFLDSLANGENGDDWVDQMIRARQSIEASFGVELAERRISSMWCTPLFGDMLANAEEFATAYNKALADYRRTHRIRGAQRPIPDLQISGESVEVPIWAYRCDERRRRLRVTRLGTKIRLQADDLTIGNLGDTELADCVTVAATLGQWRLRPRALALTIWARLLLADLFIHGIGGAKYDRISNRIIEDYYRIKPPDMACVSATLHLDFPVESEAAGDERTLRHAIRDLTFNPQRHLKLEGETARLAAQRSEAVRRSNEMKDRRSHDKAARRANFNEIRQLSSAMTSPELKTQLRDKLTGAERAAKQVRIAHGREYFFGLYPRRSLQALLDALPQEADFGV